MMKSSEIFTLPQEIASAVAIEALTFMLSDQERVGEFLAKTGVGPDDIKSRLNDPEFHAGIIDCLLSEEQILMEFCNVKEINPQHVIAARRSLPGGIADWE